MNPGPAIEEAAAAFDLAVRHLVGEQVARDVARARALLRRAAALGHEEAALVEIALGASGSGGPCDWAGSLAMLRVLAPRSAVASAQLALLDAMALTAEGEPAAPPQAERIGSAPDVRLSRGLLTPAECLHLARTAADLLEPATVFDPVTGRQVANPVRTSLGATIGPTRQDMVVTAILRRVAALTATPFENGEPLSLLLYAPGQQYRPHMDAISGSANQRTHSVLIYLNHGYGGGETRFLANGLDVAGREGDAVFFRNVRDDGSVDPQSQHAGLPVTSGVKWLATRWIRTRPFEVWSPAT